MSREPLISFADVQKSFKVDRNKKGFMPVLHRQRRPLQVLVCASTLVLSLTAGATNPDPTKTYQHAHEPIGEVQAIYDGKLSEDLAVTTFRNSDRLFPVRTIKAGGHPFPLPHSGQPIGPVAFDYKGKRYSLDDYIAINRVTGLLVLNGRISQRYAYISSSRSIEERCTGPGNASSI